MGIGGFVVLTLVITVAFFGVMILFSNAQHNSRTALIASLPDFTSSVTYTLAFNGKTLALDAVNNKFAIATGKNPPRVFTFDDLVAVEVVRNDTSITKTNRGSQAVGAAAGAVLLGPAGLLLGGLSGSKRSEDKIRKLALKIFTNDLITPVEEIVFLDGGSQGVDETQAKLFIDHLDQWHGRFQTILHMRKMT